MHDSIFRHVVTTLLMLVLVFIFWGGYVAGSHGWPWLGIVLLPVYIMIYNLIGPGGH